ncbi:MAG TPA: rhodanese-like domain-containing protein [Thermohalobaculum sp.]|nr:rhodanese-like domain-containing protein [Thermohalobaculum sp.]
MADVRPIIDEVTPVEAFRIMREDPGTVLIDVRTRAEWAFVGMPDLDALGREVWPVEWAVFPTMAPNPNFLAELSGRMTGPRPGRMFFICRSGARSMAAAAATGEAFARRGIAVHCTNVAEGFEGDRDREGHRGRVNGWKHRGLPWRQN